MRLTFLGTGTSYGVPVVGCDCDTCTSADTRDRRTRTSALVHMDGARVLVDTAPELRLQLVQAGVVSIDAVWYTHAHADHLHGIDDLRIFSARSGKPIPAYASKEHADEIRGRFRYIFDDRVVRPAGTDKPGVELRPFDPSRTVAIAGHSFQPLHVPHGEDSVFGFRVGDLGYITDGKWLPDQTVEHLRGVRVLVINALWFGNPHPTHFNVEEAVEAAGRVGAERTYLVHLTHRVRHAELIDALPNGILPAFDGLTVEV